MNGSLAKPLARRRERKVTVLFRQTEDRQHFGGVNALALTPDGQQLFTASRDATVKRWSTAGGPCQANFVGHGDWVNDCCLLALGGEGEAPELQLLATASSDRTVKLWASQSAGECLATFADHDDCVMAVAAAPRARLLASAGLRGQVFLYDINAASQVLAAHGAYQPVPAGHRPESVYALALDGRGRLVLAGATDSVVRVLDARTGSKVMKLKGHTDNVRALAVNDEGTLALSGSSDHTLRLWDLGMQRCIQSYALHTDSVWALQPAPDWSAVYSGGRDRAVYRTQLASRTSELLLHEREPVRRLALAPGGVGRLWVATTASSVSCWRVDPRLPPAPHPLVCSPGAAGGGLSTPRSAAARVPRSMDIDAHGADELADRRPAASSSADGLAEAGSSGEGECGDGAGPSELHAFVAAASPLLRSRQSFDGGSQLPAAQQRSPVLTLPGIPPVAGAAVLPDRRHVLTRDARGEVALWDITTGRIVKQYGQADMAAVERELFMPDSVPAWFSADCHLGALALQLDSRNAFLAEAYAADLGYGGAPDDLKLNMGERMLRGLFDRWLQGRSQPPPPDGLAETGTSPAADPLEDMNAMGRFRYNASPVTPVVMCQYADGQPWRLPTNQFDGREQEGDVVPAWVADAVLRNAFPASKELKCAFILQPGEGSNLPSMLQSRLNAPRILRIHKVAAYCAAKLADANVHLRLVHMWWRPRSPAGGGGGAGMQQLSEAPPSPTSGDHLHLPVLELVCNNLAVPHDMSLAAVRAYLWRKPEDLVIHYRIRDEARPAPMPHIAPPP